jgi:hypothetical protein
MASFLASLAGGGVSQAVGAVGNVLDQLFTSDEERLDKKLLMTRLAMRPDMAQIELNKVEANHRSIFVAGWRPFIGWVCGCALAYNFLVRDLLAWGLAAWSPSTQAPPSLEIGALMTVLMGLLGLGGLRTIEKLKGKTK